MTSPVSPLRSPAEVSNSLTTCHATSEPTTPTAASVAAASKVRCACGPGPDMTGRWRSSASAISRR
jgi:hypothetical protein